MPRLISVADAILGRTLAPGASAPVPAAHAVARTPIRVVVVSMDTHLSSSFERVRAQLTRDLPGLVLSQHAAAEYAGNEAAIARCRSDIAQADIVIAGMLFMEDHFLPIIDALRERRTQCDAMICMMCASEVVQLTRIGQFDMGKPASGPLAFLKKLRGSKEKAATGGAAQMKMLRRLPQMLRFIPGTAQDVRAYFIAMQYWLGGSDDNMLNLVRHVVARGADGVRRPLRPLAKAAPPVEYPEVGVYHPRMKQRLSAEPMGGSPADYARWALDVPMYFVKRGETYHDVAGADFLDLLAFARVHLQEAPDALLARAVRHVDLVARRERARVDAEECKLADVRVAGAKIGKKGDQVGHMF